MSYYTYSGLGQITQAAAGYGTISGGKNHPGLSLGWVGSGGKNRQGLYGYGATAGSTPATPSSGTFNAAAIWVDCQAGAPPSNNAAGKRCGQSVQIGLNALGYGPLSTDGQIGPATMAAIKAFSQDNGFGSANWPTKAMLQKMQELLQAGQVTGPAPPVLSHVVGGEVVPGAAPGSGAKGLAKLSTGMKIGLGVAAAAAVLGIAVLASKKKKGEHAPSSGVRKAAANW